MADIKLGKKIGFLSATELEPIEVKNGTDTVRLVFSDDYSKISLEVTDADGNVKYYDVALTLRT